MASIEAKVQSDIDAMVSEHPMGESLAEMALSAARKLDGTVEDKSYAGIQRELRATLIELAKYAAAGADDLEDELSAPTEGDPG